MSRVGQVAGQVAGRLAVGLVVVMLAAAVWMVGGMGTASAPGAEYRLVVADHAGERRVPPGHSVDGRPPFWANMPYTMATGGGEVSRPVPRMTMGAVQQWATDWEAWKMGGHRLAGSEAVES